MSSLLNSLASEAVPKEDPDADYAGYGGAPAPSAPLAPPPPHISRVLSTMRRVTT